MISELAGWVGVGGSILLWGSFGVPIKGIKVDVHPLLFQLIYSIVVTLTSLLILIFEPFVFTWFGILSGSSWVICSVLSILAVRSKAGLAVAQGVWSGVTMITSFTWGSLIFPQSDHQIRSLPLSILALSLLFVGILLLSWSSRVEQDESFAKLEDDDDPPEPSKNLGWLGGLICSFSNGLLNGSLMVPLRLTEKDAQGPVFVISFGIGCLAMTVLIVTVYFLARRQRPIFHFRVAGPAAIGAGLLWSGGNLCATIAAASPLGLTIGFPLTQLGLVVAALWGLLFFCEVKATPKRVGFGVAVVIIAGGAVLLSLFA